MCIEKNEAIGNVLVLTMSFRLSAHFFRFSFAAASSSVTLTLPFRSTCTLAFRADVVVVVATPPQGVAVSAVITVEPSRST